MLSDFDLAKQSNERGGRPATIHTEENGVRSCLPYLRSPRLLIRDLSFYAAVCRRLL